MNSILMVRNRIKDFIESYYFIAFLSLFSLAGFYVSFKLPFLFLFAVILLFVIITNSSFKSMILLLFSYFSLQDGRQFTIPSPTYFVLIGIFTIVFICALVRVILHFKEYLEKVKKDWLLYSLLVILIPMLLSLINTENLFLSFIGIGNFIVIILSYLFVKIAVPNTKENRNYIIVSIISTALVLSICCISKTFMKLNEGFNFWDIFNRKLLSFGWLNSNHYTAFVNIAIILCVYLFTTIKTIWKRVLIMSSIYVFLVVDVLTVCRAGLLALGVTVILSIVVYFIYNKKYEKNKIAKDAFYLIPLAVGIVFGFIFLYKEGILAELVNRFETIGISENGRNDVYETAIEKFKLHPIIGMGVYTTHLYIEYWYYHNYVLQMLGTCGIIGLIAFIGYVVFSIKRSFRLNLYSVFILIIISYYLIHGLFDTVYFHQYLMPILCVLQALDYKVEEKEETNLFEFVEVEPKE